MKPREFLLAYTKEHFSITSKSNVCALIEGKSSLARIGLGIHITAPIIHCGFGEKKPLPIMLELFNHSENLIILRKNIKIAQLLFLQITGKMNSKGAKMLGNSQPLSKNKSYRKAS